jgi:hypothetical protein
MRFTTFRWLLLVALCVGVVLAVGCAHEKPVARVTKPRPLIVDSPRKPDTPSGKTPVAVKRNHPQRPDLVVIQREVTLRWADKNGTQMTCSAKSASFNEVSQVGTLVDFSAKLYENGSLTASVIAPLATADTAKRVIVASGGVVLRSLQRDTVVKAGWIKWYAGSDKVVGNGGVSIKSTNGSVDGAAFVADTALKTLSVKSSGKGLE